MSIQPDNHHISLTEAESQQAEMQKELETLRADYREFVYSVAHDLAGPFRQIEGFANIILSTHGDQFDDKTKRQLNLIIAGSEKGKVILEALLAYSRLISSDLSYSPVDCNSVIEDVTSELTNLIETTDAEFQFKGVANNASPIVIGDKTQLYQLFFHVIHNALHYRKSTFPPKISIETMELEREWQFSITDNGIGIREKLADRIFTAFKRGVAENNYSGIGMGLTIARSVVQRHGGKIWVSSEPDSGSSFYFTLCKEKLHD